MMSLRTFAAAAVLSLANGFQHRPSFTVSLDVPAGHSRRGLSSEDVSLLQQENGQSQEADIDTAFQNRVHLTGQGLEDFAKAMNGFHREHTAVMFYEPGCPVCHAFAPVFTSLSAQVDSWKGKASTDLALINCHVAKGVCDALHIMHVPAILMGRTVDWSNLAASGGGSKLTSYNGQLDGADFLAWLGSQAVVSLHEDLGNGLRIEVEHPGDNQNFPQAGNVLTMHYTLTLAQDASKVIDSSRARGQPLKFTIGQGQVIQGWDQGIMKMSLGERGLLYVPAALGYGSAGAGNGVIPPNADLVFDVEVLGIGGNYAPYAR